MPLPLAPIAGFALRYGAVALTTYAIARSIEKGRRCQKTEDVLDEVEEGLSLRREEGQFSTTGRFIRTIRLGQNGPGAQIDLSALGRLRLTRVR
ncbi:hypothetical protein [Cochlodiniinecator piscidefendens]|uniref:hypothetical protein n=1 Tax=Cochlodiniinecator piscidefendens TaxID=2715756 RepID=UPI00140797FC|nr:hypothetical protein [Cochlodiniinecator piscidefendens]